MLAMRYLITFYSFTPNVTSPGLHLFEIEIGVRSRVLP